MNENRFPRTNDVSRADQLIAAAKEAGRDSGKFSLSWLLLSVLLVSIALAVLRQMGVLAFWKSYFQFTLFSAYLFAPLLCWWAAALFWRRPRGHNKLAAVGSGVIAVACFLFLFFTGAPANAYVGTAIVGAILWCIQVLCMVAVQWSILWPRRSRRVLPDRLPTDPSSS